MKDMKLSPQEPSSPTRPVSLLTLLSREEERTTQFSLGASSLQMGTGVLGLAQPTPPLLAWAYSVLPRKGLTEEGWRPGLPERAQSKLSAEFVCGGIERQRSLPSHLS